MTRNKTDYRYLLPAVIVVAIMTQVPFVMTLIFSTIRWNLSRPDIPRTFTGLSNYLFFLKIENRDLIPPFYSILLQTIFITGITLLLCAVFGFLLALLLDNKIPGINIARTLILGPFFVMSTATGVIWKTMFFNTTFGWFGVTSKAFGITPVDWISYHPLITVTLLTTWQWMPFFVLVLLAGLQGLDQEILACARIDGTNWIQNILLIKLPLIMNHLRVAIMLGIVFIIKDFGIILTTTVGGPGTRTHTLPFYVREQVFTANNVGRASALAVMTVALTLGLVNLIYRSIEKRRAVYN